MNRTTAFLRGLLRPEAYHGTGVTSRFFEGWYVKLVSADRRHRWAVIPGIFRGPAGERDEAFVQVLDGSTGRSWYHAFAVEDFAASAERFDVRVGSSRFSTTGFDLDLPQLRGRVDVTTPFEPWPVTWRSPGIMGWYGLVPFMECYHGLQSFGHALGGHVDVEGSAVSFDGGRGYLEKDWGRAFPAGYVWVHSNHIDTEPDACLTASVALIPWVRSTFRGFIVGLRHHGRLYRWTTYNSSRERVLRVTDDLVEWELVGPDGVLGLRARRVRGGLLHAPLRSAMHQRVEETLDAVVEIRHLHPDGRVGLAGRGECAGLEVFGEIDRLVATRGR